MNTIMIETPKVIDGYKVYLAVKYRDHFKKYCSLLKNQPESAKAEGVLFSLLRPRCQNVTIAEDINTGGVDFLCEINDSRFIVEVTCLESESVTRQSGLENDISEDGKTTWFRMISDKLLTKTSNKTRQLSGFPMPRVLAITTEHIMGEALLGKRAAEYILTGEQKIGVPINKPKSETRSITDLKNSVFIRPNNGVIESCKNSISAIILVHILVDKCYVVGVLHPDPVYIFPINFFPNVPFVRLKKWPIENNKIATEWVTYSPPRAKLHYQTVELKDEEYRNF